ncbi:hypothetical protein RND81_12G037600 [Saponaria officinalis]|uniref:Leucine-rich repeat-containing N-terminal plant-type domain-containing protein n=2 Tax=Saponaria officinalis TaxID=3572 RepID=A0AAW1H534_SAPOF
MNHLLFLTTLLISFPILAYSQCNLQDKAILLQIKSHFGSVGLLSDWDPNTECCDWAFIGCTSDYDPNPDRVNAVTISGGSGLKGTIPDILGNLPFLNNIMFFDEPKLIGPIPQTLSKLTMLRVITLNSNGLSGPIPTFLGNLKSLRQVDISDNKFTGNFPASLGTLRQLTQFNVSHNLVTGSIPNLSKSLTSLDVSFNQLCGKIPSGLSKFGLSMFQHNKCLCGAPLSPCKS